ncbi:MAG: acetolactate decarboxylase [Methanofollis sp.]|nr:acetolactate decarboxylase [Methanofollis sp.]
MIPQIWRFGALLILLIAAAGFMVSSTVRWAENDEETTETLYQVSTIGALLDGVYDGVEEFGTLTDHGDTGIGTPGALDGEIVILDGEVWQIRGDGSVRQIDPATRAAFAAVTFFDDDISFELNGPVSLPELEAAIEDALPSWNYPVAVLVKGEFANLTARSVDAQTEPYPPLVEATASQHVFTFNRTAGALVGFYLPPYMAGVNVRGFHLHYLSDDRTGGGHLLGCTADRVRVSLDTTPYFRLVLPGNGAFAGADLAGDRSDEVDAAERGGAR